MTLISTLGATTQALTMTTSEIAMVVDSRTDSVKRTVDRLVERGVISQPPAVDGIRSANGITVKEYQLGKRDSLIVVAQLCPEFTARIVDRWQELEAQQTSPKIDPANFSRMQLIELAMQAESERLELAAKVEVMAPKVAALDRIKTADGMLNLQAAGKLLQQQPNKFIQWLREHGWIYKRAGSKTNSARAEKFNVGYLATKISTTIHADGTERIHEQVMITPKGLAKLAGIFAMPSPEF